MKKKGSYEAKTNLPKLLKAVTQGERFTITRHGVPIAMLVPVTARANKTVKNVIEDIFRFQSSHTLGGLSIREMIDEGRV